MPALCLGSTVLDYQQIVNNIVRQGQKGMTIAEIYGLFKRRDILREDDRPG